MPSFHIRSSDGELVPCRDGKGRILESCGLHGAADIIAPDVEGAWAAMDSRERAAAPSAGLGMGSSSSRGAWACLSACLPGSRPSPVLRGSAVMVRGLLSRNRG